MICEICREAVATVHLTEIVNNSKKEIHLCEACAEQKGVAIQSQVKSLSIPEFFGQMAESKDEPGPGGVELHCPVCGMTYRQFRTGGKLGCPNDYQVFREELSQLLEKIHGSTQHPGKLPVRFGIEERRRRQIEQLRTELQHAVRAEEFERAAQLRDEIYDLEREQCS